MHRSPWSRRLARLVLGLAVGLALVVALTSAVAAQATPSPTTENPTISVSGTGTITVDPDVAYVTLGVTKTETRLSDAQDQVNQIMTSITDIATSDGVDKKDIKTVDYSVTVINKLDTDGNIIGVQGYTVSNTVTIAVRDLDSVGKLLDQMVSAGANMVYGISFGLSDPTSATEQARQAAAADAKAKANDYSAALGVTIIGVQSLQETLTPPVLARESSGAVAPASLADSSAVPVSAGSMEITVTVQVVFLIGPGA